MTGMESQIIAASLVSALVGGLVSLMVTAMKQRTAAHQLSVEDKSATGDLMVSATKSVTDLLDELQQIHQENSQIREKQLSQEKTIQGLSDDVRDLKTQNTQLRKDNDLLSQNLDQMNADYTLCLEQLGVDTLSDLADIQLRHPVSDED